MTVNDFASQIGAEFIAGTGGGNRVISGCYIGDLLSFVMGKAQCGDCWITIMSNLNVIGVGSLTDVACILLAEGVKLDQNAKEKADEEDIAVLSSDKSAYELAACLSKLI